MRRPCPVTQQREVPTGPQQMVKYRRPWVWRLSIIIILIVIIAIVVPIAVVFSRRTSSPTPTSSVLLPLYIHPSGDAWQPIYTALNTTSTLNYTIIINPSSGPGSSAFPDADYISAITKVNAYPNAKTVGYVPTTYATRNITLILDDITTYSRWSAHSGLAMDGIFFDEVPHQYSAEVASYLSTIDTAVKQAPGISGEKTVIHNPGTIPDANLSNTDTDIIVAFEESYTTYQAQRNALSSLPLDRTHYAFLIHGVPTSTNLGDLISNMAQNAGNLFITDLMGDYYESFGSDWDSFVHTIPS